MEQALFYNNVTLLDFAYLDKKFVVHGESYRVDVELVGSLDQENMIFDFSKSKKLIKEIIDKECDHRLVVAESLVKKESGIGVLDKQALYYRAPLDAFCLVPFEDFNKEELRVFLEKMLLAHMPTNVTTIRINLTPEKTYNSVFHYTHGLRDHYGNCQRLLHGHRSSIEIFKDGERDFDLEVQFVEKFLKSSVHFAFRDNLVSKDLKNGFQTETPLVHLKYKSNQGEFEAKIPGKELYVMDDETTVENLATHFCDLAKTIVDQSGTVTLKAYEGIGKGGKATSSF